MADSDDDTPPQLSAAALAALGAFYQEREEAEKRFRELAAAAEDAFVVGTKAIAEDWQLSQFWYDDATAETLARLSLKHAGNDGLILCISAPTAFAKIKVAPRTMGRRRPQGRHSR